ncbi:uncharacterized protein B0H64DRAFT_459234 [Chaetomium fimeti]|uniref:Uncharacterized protein n=1 Tax=Chaetomium fimeti TaxID=1854472 RepID=A0AAE0HFB9_9PEZI|nr:hypothetical protein B0H64DRAFT_459234 [Chaetomium fimeti]
MAERFSLPFPRLVFRPFITLGFGFGTELESLVTPKKAIYDELEKHGFNHGLQPGGSGVEYDRMIEANGKALIKTLAALLLAAGIRTSLDDVTFEAWNIKLEPVLRLYHPRRCQIFNWEWHNTIERIYDVLNLYFEMWWTSGCSQHVHPQPGPDPGLPQAPSRGWTVYQARSLLRAIAVFDDAITKIMPEDRKENTWARSSFHDIKLEQAIRADKARANKPGALASHATPQSTLPVEARNLVRLFGEVTTKSWDHLFNWSDGLKLTQSICIGTGSDRFLSWNFMPLMDPRGTIEFRRPPGAMTAESAQKWVIFAVAFASASFEDKWKDTWRHKKDHATVSELQEFIKTGLMRLGGEWEGVLDPMEIFVEVTSEAAPLESS